MSKSLLSTIPVIWQTSRWEFKNVCITGAGNGIGQAIAIAMSKEGYNVICADIDFEEAEKTVGQEDW